MRYSFLSLILSALASIFRTGLGEFSRRVFGKFNPFILIETVEMFGLFLPLCFVFSEDGACFYFTVLLAWLIVVFSPSALRLIQHIAVSLRVTFSLYAY